MPPEKIKRFRKSERLVHWAIALPFLICMASAAVLVLIYNPNPLRPYREIFSWTHRVSGLLLIVVPLLVLATHWRDYKIHWSNVKEAWGWSRDDFKWLALMGLAVVSKRIVLPEEGKFNAGEKLNFMMSTVNHPLLGATGIVLWLTHGAIVPWFVHFSLAVASIPLVAGHIFMATINPASRVGLSGMFSGFVDREWARHHYRRWFREQFDGDHVFPKASRSRRATGGLDALHPPARRGRWLKRAVLAAVVLVAPAGVMFVIGGFVAPKPAPPTPEYVAQRAPLVCLPIADAVPVPGGPLLAGSRVTRLLVAGEFALVQDIQGRAGYVPLSTLVTTPPRVDPGASEFADCRPALLEVDAGGCHQRARSKLDDCNVACTTSATPTCAALCQERYESCFRGCDIPLAVQFGDVPPKVVGEEPDDATDAAPAPDAETKRRLPRKRAARARRR